MTKIAKETIEQKESIDKNNDAVKRFEERQKQKQVEEQSELDKAFVEEDKRVLDPTLLKKSLIDRMPDPTGWRVLVLFPSHDRC